MILFRNKGFTLIELLITIAIIGILSSVVLGSLNSARDKGSDAKIKASLSNARTQAESYYDSNVGSYATLCTAANGLQNIVGSLQQTSGAVACDSDASSWALSAQLKTSTTTYWCVDNTGTSSAKTDSSIGSGPYACPAS